VGFLRLVVHRLKQGVTVARGSSIERDARPGECLPKIVVHGNAQLTEFSTRLGQENEKLLQEKRQLSPVSRRCVTPVRSLWAIKVRRRHDSHSLHALDIRETISARSSKS